MAASSSETTAPAAGKKGAAPPRPPPRCARDALVFAAGVAAAVLALLGPASPSALARGGWRVGFGGGGLVASPGPGPEDGPRTFYDDPDLSYAVGARIADWDAKRAAWLRSRGLVGAIGGRRRERVVMVTGSQPEPCRGAGGDHLLLRFLKNKVDYCRLHGIELLYNNAHLEPSMAAYWAKIPAVRAAMLAHPDAEWVWWVDADAVFTDMDFSLLPLLTTGKYAAYNLVLYGWPKEVYENRRWLGLNAGVFLIRNCQWSLEFLDEWARMGPASPDYRAWGRKVKAALTDRDSDVACDQSALAYMLVTGRERWGDKTHLAADFYFQGYFAEIVGKFAGVAARYAAVERRGRPGLRRRHAEREHLRYAAARNVAVRETVPGPDGGGQSGWRRPFVTHFTGCNPCGGRRNPMYSRELCDGGMRRALAFADDQVLRAYGFRHAGPRNESILPLPFDYPAARRNR